MRLLNASTLELESFQPGKIPDYAILSHTWNDGEEVLFHDIGASSAEAKAGFQKLQFACEEAVRDGLSYVWIDTCCIDKSSSAELSEAINSMYDWYSLAKICYAYLSDVTAKASGEFTESEFTYSKWFTRGWTLQELIAPSNLVFFSCDWIKIGTKTSLSNLVSNITDIEVDILTGSRDLEDESIARRMSWVAERETTRPEDIAYCLMGLFSVNMPMLYGEGPKAFIRLQEEIMRHSDDHSIFAWFDAAASPASYCGLLAKEPKFFKGCGGIRAFTSRAPFEMTNRGLRINLPLIPTDEDDLFIGVLDCANIEDTLLSGIYLRTVSAGNDTSQYARVQVNLLAKVSGEAKSENKDVSVRQNILLPGPQDIYRRNLIQLRRGPEKRFTYRLSEVFVPPGILKLDVGTHGSSDEVSWIPHGTRSKFIVPSGIGNVAAVLVLHHVASHEKEWVIVRLATSANFGVGFDAIEIESVPDFKTLVQFAKPIRPCKPGSWICLTRHLVKVDTQEFTRLGAKWHFVDVFASPIAKDQNQDERDLNGSLKTLLGQPKAVPNPEGEAQPLKSLLRTLKFKKTSRS